MYTGDIPESTDVVYICTQETYLSPLMLFIRDSESTPVPGSTNGVSFYRTVTDFNTG